MHLCLICFGKLNLFSSIFIFLILNAHFNLIISYLFKFGINVVVTKISTSLFFIKSAFFSYFLCFDCFLSQFVLFASFSLLFFKVCLVMCPSKILRHLVFFFDFLLLTFRCFQQYFIGFFYF